MNKNLSRLLVGHTFVTLAAGVVLLVSPGTIPGFAGIWIDSSATCWATYWAQVRSVWPRFLISAVG